MGRIDGFESQVNTAKAVIQTLAKSVKEGKYTGKIKAEKVRYRHVLRIPQYKQALTYPHLGRRHGILIWLLQHTRRHRRSA